MELRRSTLAGSFYPAESSVLRKQLKSFFANIPDKSLSALPEPFGVVSPHAGIIFSGQTSAYAFSAIPKEFTGTFVVIGPSHTGYPDCVSSENWETPLGTLKNDNDFIKNLDIPVDNYAHRKKENSLEVQMQFIKYRFPDCKIVPILMGSQTRRNSLSVAEKVFRAVELSESPVKIIASSDFSHYIPDKEARMLDNYAIDALLNLDTAEFYQRIIDEGISACGYGPITVMAEVSKRLGAKRAIKLHYSTSGDINGDRSQVVGYASLAVV
ncbi:AmmeMemoRadiSam system protein B [Methanoplanus endosymbiosus]|uniref:MEMO1 family protein L6E24_04800 n=1 Tax=Methanoplanus endosymbiosus TaxID=33865 RepID=A0A9E7THR8_9EURY|nr:AmmeMemoRadiSam system protein B [Methanoplanus endosymbiosus]UUX93447.1 AmmeMemoRadiSam system protein B [Methanoplanus endosymbiosus]